MCYLALQVQWRSLAGRVVARQYFSGRLGSCRLPASMQLSSSSTAASTPWPFTEDFQNFKMVQNVETLEAKVVPQKQGVQALQ
jgi:hypothetical protein